MSLICTISSADSSQWLVWFAAADRKTGASRGFAFVIFYDKKDA